MLTKDQYFEQWWPTSVPYALYQYNLPLEEFSDVFKQDARTGNYGFEEDWNAYNSQQLAVQAQLQSAEQLKQQQDIALAEVSKQANISKRMSAAAVGQQRLKSAVAVDQAQQQINTAAAQIQTKKAGQTVGQPGISKTKVGARLALGGYGGTTAGRINPTGLNI